MSTEKGDAKRRLSSEGPRIEPDTANLDHAQQQQQQQQSQQQQQQQQQQQYQTQDSSAQKRPQHPQQPAQAAQGEASSEAADKENVKQPAVGGASGDAGAERTSTRSRPISASARGGIAEESTAPVGERAEPDDAPPRQVIAVSASKSPAAFFNLARKFLVTNEMCDLSALERAIVSAVDAAHLLERSQLASIVRIHTSYVTVEPKRRKTAPQPQSDSDAILIQPAQSESETTTAHPSGAHPLLSSGTTTAIETPTTAERSGDFKPAAKPPGSRNLPASSAKPSGEIVPTTAFAGPVAAPGPAPRFQTTTTVGATRQGGPRSASSGGRELRRARIVVTVRRTESYKRWLEENPLQAIIASDEVDEDAVMDAAIEEPTPPPARAAPT